MASADGQIDELEAQLAANQAEVDQAKAYERQLAEAEVEKEKVKAEVEALRAELEKARGERDAAATKLVCSFVLGFDRCAVISPDLPLELLEPGNEIFQGRLVRPKLDAPLEEAEVLFENSVVEEESEGEESL